MHQHQLVGREKHQTGAPIICQGLGICSKTAAAWGASNEMRLLGDTTPLVGRAYGAPLMMDCDQFRQWQVTQCQSATSPALALWHFSCDPEVPSLLCVLCVVRNGPLYFALTNRPRLFSQTPPTNRRILPTLVYPALCQVNSIHRQENSACRYGCAAAG